MFRARQTAGLAARFIPPANYPLQPSIINSPQRLSSAVRLFSSSDSFSIQWDLIDVKFLRSQGPGGQNVNKVNTKVEMRFDVLAAEWIPFEVRARLAEQQAHRMNKDGELILSSQEHRTQHRNREECMNKIKLIIEEAKVAPKVRKQYKGLSEKGKSRRRDDKRFRGKVKANRGKISKKDF